MTLLWVNELKNMLGAEKVLTAPGDLFLYAYDAALDKNLPAAVLLPRSTDDVVAAVRVCRRHQVPYTARGAGTNLCGGSVPRSGGLVVHMGAFKKILSIDPDRRRAWVEPGVVNLTLQRALAPHHLFYAPDPGSQKACTLGGNVGTNAGGPHCLKHGVTTTHVTGLEVVLPSGEVVTLSVEEPGLDLTGFWVGSEGTLGIVTKIEVNLLPVSPSIQTFLVAFPTMDAAALTVTEIVSAGVLPTTLEVVDRLTVDAVEAFLNAGYPRDVDAVLLIEVDGTAEETHRDSEKIRAICARNGATEIRHARDDREREKFWEGRRGAYPALARLAPNVLVEDGVVPRTRLPEAVRRMRAIAARENIRMGLIAHAGDGNLHPNMIFDERNADETRRVKAAGEEMLKVCVELGGSISGEHGIGTDKREAMKRLFTPDTLSFFHALKRTLDPELLANPEKILPVVEGPPATPPRTPSGDPASPSTTLEAAGYLAWAQEEHKPVFIRGLGTSHRKPRPGALILDTRGLARVLDHDRDNFTVTVEAGLLLSELDCFLSPFGQHAHLAGAAGTVGGCLARGLPRGNRNEVLGLRAVLPGGAVVALGGKVVKNVAGYDAIKLFLGSWGTLGVITEVTLRLHPRPGAPGLLLDIPPVWNQLPNAGLHQKIQRTIDPLGLLVFEENSRG